MNINKAIERGFKFCAISSDVDFLRAAATNAINSVKGMKASDTQHVEI